MTVKEDLNDLVKKYTIKQDRAIKRICAPLHDLNIAHLGYAVVKSDGTFCNLSTFPSFLEYFYGEEMYNTQPYYSNPDLFRSGYTLISCTANPLFQKKCETRYDINYALCRLQKHRDYMELFYFHSLDDDPQNCSTYIKNIHLLDKFASYFRQEAKGLITNALAEGYNISKARGTAFYEASPDLKLLNNDFNKQQFLKKICPLTDRENQCLELFKEGRSTQATAAILNLSQRTVEHYFDNIKAKLGCKSKLELLER